MGGGILTSVQQQVMETIQDAESELDDAEFLIFLGWLEGRVVAEQEFYRALHEETKE